MYCSCDLKVRLLLINTPAFPLCGPQQWWVISIGTRYCIWPGHLINKNNGPFKLIFSGHVFILFHNKMPLKNPELVHCVASYEVWKLFVFFGPPCVCCRSCCFMLKRSQSIKSCRIQNDSQRSVFKILITFHESNKHFLKRVWNRFLQLLSTNTD